MLEQYKTAKRCVTKMYRRWALDARAYPGAPYDLTDVRKSCRIWTLDARTYPWLVQDLKNP